MRSARPPASSAADRGPAAPAGARRAGALLRVALGLFVGLSFGALPVPAFAQEAPAAPAAAPTTVWAKGPLQGTRFPESTAVSLTAADGDPLSVVAAWDGRYRVRRGLEFGWVSALSVSLVEPSPADGGPVPLQLGGPAPSLR
jgi:hypothetical protein